MLSPTPGVLKSMPFFIFFFLFQPSSVAGSDIQNFFKGFGSDHLSVSRTVTCTPYNVGEKDAFDIPFPCVLRECYCYPAVSRCLKAP